MTDELDVLRGTRANVAPPSAAARRAARAGWEADLLDLTAPVHVRPARGYRTFTLRTAIAGVVAAVLVAGGWIVTRQRIESVKPKHVVAISSLPEVAATDPQVFLLVGSDSRAFVNSSADARQYGDPGTVDGARSDTMVLVRIDPKTRHVLVVSIPRDLWVDVPGCGMQKINAAFNSAVVCGGTHGGAQLLVDTITHDLAVPVNHVIEVQFPQFASLVDQLGGLRIQFPVPARDSYTGLNEPAGCAVLDGNEALAFVRSRHYQYNFNDQWTYDPTGDLGRMTRQQLALRQLAAAAEARVGTDPRPLLRALFADITVDSGFTADDALRYFAALRGDHPTITMTLPVRQSMADNQEILLLDPAAQPALDALAGRGTIADPSAGTAAKGGEQLEPAAC